MIKSIFLNSGSNVAVFFLKMALTFIMAPILIRNLGNYDYGLWEMFGAILGYMGMLDLGLSPAVNRYAAKHYGDGDKISQQNVFNSALVFMVLIGFLLAVAFCLWAIFFPNVIANVESNDQVKYTILLLAFSVQLLIFFPGRVAESYLEGFQRYHIKNVIIIVNSLIGTFILYNYISPQNGLILLACVNVIGGSVKYIIYMYMITVPRIVGVKYKLSDFSPNKLKELLIFGSKSLIQGIATRIETSTDSLVIGAFLGPGYVPFYSIVANLVQYVRSLAATVCHVFLPVFSTMESAQDQSKVVRLYIEASKYVIAFVICLSAGILIYGQAFISIWIGPEFADSFLLFALIVSFVCLSLLNPLSGRYLVAYGKHGILARVGLLSAISNILLSCILVQHFGIEGVAAGSLIPTLITAPYLLRFCCKELQIPVRFYIHRAIVPSVMPLTIMTTCSLLAKQNIPITNYSTLAISSVLSGLVFYTTFVRISLDRDERKMFLNIFRRKGN